MQNSQFASISEELQAGSVCTPRQRERTSPEESRRLFDFRSDELEYLFVEDLGRRTVGSSVVLRVFIALAWVVSWRKMPHNLIGDSGVVTKSRYIVLTNIWMVGAITQVISAVVLLRTRKFHLHERLKARSYVATITLAMVGCIMLKQKEAQTTLATAIPCMLIYGGYMVFEQFRFKSQLQLQALHMLAFLFVAIGSFFNTGNSNTLFIDVAVFMPVIVTCQLGVCALLESHARSMFLSERGRPSSQLGLFWHYLGHVLSVLKDKLR